MSVYTLCSTYFDLLYPLAYKEFKIAIYFYYNSKNSGNIYYFSTRLIQPEQVYIFEVIWEIVLYIGQYWSRHVRLGQNWHMLANIFPKDLLI